MLGCSRSAIDKILDQYLTELDGRPGFDAGELDARAQRDAVHFRRIGLGDHCDAQRATRARELLDQQLRSLVHCAGMVALVRDDGMTAGLRFEDAVQTVA